LIGSSPDATGVAGDGRLPFTVETTLCESIAEIAAWAKSVRAIKADLVIVDAPGAMGTAFGASIAVCDLALIPSGATVLDVRGAAETVKLVRQHRRASGKPKPDILLVLARIDRRTVAGKEAVTTLAALAFSIAPRLEVSFDKCGPAGSYRARPATEESYT
jgi:chromosome partitioning protein